MRFVYLTDDAKSIDRRTLHQADTLAENGHEVIIVARQDGTAPTSARVGGAKIHWVTNDYPRFVGPTFLAFVIGFLRGLKQAVAGSGRQSWLKKIKLTGPLRTLALFLVRRDTEWPRLIRRSGDKWMPLLRRLRIWLLVLVLSIPIAIVSLFAGLLTLAKSTLQAMSYNPAGTGKGIMVATPWDKTMAHYGAYYDPDVIVATDLPQLMGAVMAKRATGAALAYDSHEFYSDISSLSPQERRFLRTRERKLLPKVDVAITVNPFITDLFKAVYGKTFVTIQNATTTPKGFKPGVKGTLFHKHLKLPKETKILLYQGWMPRHVRGLEELIEAFAFVKTDVQLVMMGYGDFDAFGEVARAAGASDRVHFVNAVAQDDLIWWSASADVGVIPYKAIDKLHELCSPNKLYEFIAARLPILANDLPFLRQVVHGEGFGLTRDLGTPESIAKAIDEIFDPTADHLQKAKSNMMEKGERWEWSAESKLFMEAIQSLKPQGPIRHFRNETKRLVTYSGLSDRGDEKILVPN